jgi:hypothetical protein
MKGKNREGNLILEPLDALKYELYETLITLRSLVVNFCALVFLCSMFLVLTRCIF